jgi:hypothetical protein
MVIDGLSGTLELNALPKDDIKKFILSSASETIMPKDGMLEKVGVFGLAIFFLAVVIAIISLLKFLLKKYLRLQRILDTLIRVVCWNMVIKTFQAGFLAYSMTAV